MVGNLSTELAVWLNVVDMLVRAKGLVVDADDDSRIREKFVGPVGLLFRRGMKMVLESELEFKKIDCSLK